VPLYVVLAGQMLRANGFPHLRWQCSRGPDVFLKMRVAQPQVRGVIVESVPVNPVDVVPGLEFDASALFVHETMLGDPLAGCDSDPSVAVRYYIASQGFLLLDGAPGCSGAGHRMVALGTGVGTEVASASRADARFVSPLCSTLCHTRSLLLQILHVHLANQIEEIPLTTNDVSLGELSRRLDEFRAEVRDQNAGLARDIRALRTELVDRGVYDAHRAADLERITRLEAELLTMEDHRRVNRRVAYSAAFTAAAGALVTIGTHFFTINPH
jgi:hypothetical protein